MKFEKGEGSKGLERPCSLTEKQVFTKSRVEVVSPSKKSKKPRIEDQSTKRSGRFVDERASKSFEHLKEVGFFD